MLHLGFRANFGVEKNVLKVIGHSLLVIALSEVDKKTCDDNDS